MPSFVPAALCLLLLAACAQAPSPVVQVPTRLEIPTQTASPTASATVTPSDTPTPTNTATLTATVPTATVSATVTPSATITDTPTRTPTNTPVPTPTLTATLAESGIGLLLTAAFQFTPLPTQFQVAPATLIATAPVIGSPGTTVAGTPAAQCQFLPAGGFGQVYVGDPGLAAQLGCPVGAPPIAASLLSAGQPFERGAMVYVNNPPGYVYVLNADGTFRRYDDTYIAGVDPETTGLTPPAGLLEPVRGFGKVWRTNDPVRSGLGWATAAEQGTTATVQDFINGRMLSLPAPVRGDILVLIYAAGSPQSGTWRSVAGQF